MCMLLAIKVVPLRPPYLPFSFTYLRGRTISISMIIPNPHYFLIGFNSTCICWANMTEHACWLLTPGFDGTTFKFGIVCWSCLWPCISRKTSLDIQPSTFPLGILVGNIPASLVCGSTWFLYMVGAGTCWTPMWKGAVKGSMKDGGGWLIPWQVAKACALETTSFESRGRAWTGTWECTWWSRWWGHVRAFVGGLHCCSQNGWFDSYHKQSSRYQISSRWARISPNFKTAPVDGCSDGASWGVCKKGQKIGICPEGHTITNSKHR